VNDCLHAAVVTTNITAELVCHRCDDCRTSWWEDDGRKVPLAEALDKLKALVDRLLARPYQLVPRDLIDTATVAALFNVTQRSVTNWVAWGRLSAVRTPGGGLRFSRAEVLELARMRAA
jgi:excisionase family DNA binding protein